MGLYMSIVLRPHKSFDDLVPLTMEVARAVRDAVQQFTGIEGELKWPNDVLLNGRKVSGILLETVSRASGPTPLIVGIGVNLRGTRDLFPLELRDTATTLEAESGRAPSREEWIAGALPLLEKRYLDFLNRTERVAS